MRRVLVTRPRPDADRTAAMVRAAGHEALVHPLMRIETRADALAGAPDADALAFTSANGVRAYAGAGGAPLPAYVVGPASARAARAAGLPVAGVAEGDVDALAALIADAAPGQVLHACGAAAGDLAGTLRAAGVPCARAVLYDAVAEAALPEAAARDIAAGVDWVVLHSPRSARLLVALVREAGLAGTLTRARLAALSPAVAAAAGDAFAEARVAASPSSSALVDFISAGDT